MLLSLLQLLYVQTMYIYYFESKYYIILNVSSVVSGINKIEFITYFVE